MPMVCIKHRLKKDCNENRKIVHAQGVYKVEMPMMCIKQTLMKIERLYMPKVCIKQKDEIR